MTLRHISGEIIKLPNHTNRQKSVVWHLSKHAKKKKKLEVTMFWGKLFSTFKEI